jgi:hypothetical protein
MSTPASSTALELSITSLDDVDPSHHDEQQWWTRACIIHAPLQDIPGRQNNIASFQDDINLFGAKLLTEFAICEALLKHHPTDYVCRIVNEVVLPDWFFHVSNLVRHISTPRVDGSSTELLDRPTLKHGQWWSNFLSNPWWSLQLWFKHHQLKWRVIVHRGGIEAVQVSHESIELQETMCVIDEAFSSLVAHKPLPHKRSSNSMSNLEELKPKLYCGDLVLPHGCKDEVITQRVLQCLKQNRRDRTATIMQDCRTNVSAAHVFWRALCRAKTSSSSNLTTLGAWRNVSSPTNSNLSSATEMWDSLTVIQLGKTVDAKRIVGIVGQYFANGLAQSNYTRGEWRLFDDWVYLVDTLPEGESLVPTIPLIWPVAFTTLNRITGCETLDFETMAKSSSSLIASVEQTWQWITTTASCSNLTLWQDVFKQEHSTSMLTIICDVLRLSIARSWHNLPPEGMNCSVSFDSNCCARLLFFLSNDVNYMIEKVKLTRAFGNLPWKENMAQIYKLVDTALAKAQKQDVKVRFVEYYTL